MIVVLYYGDEREVVTITGLKHIERCYNPFCKKYVQTRPDNPAMAGRPKRYCHQRCRWSWKQKRNKERQYRIAEHNQRRQSRERTKNSKQVDGPARAHG